MSLIKPIGDAKILDKRVQKNKKYEDVKATINSGHTLDKEIKKKGEASLNARFRRDENFKRIKKSELAKKMMINEEDEKSFLILDLRDNDEYGACHLLDALHYPAPMLTRSVNPYLPEIYTFKNKENKIIVAYDLDEKIAIPTGNLFFEKGFDNVYILTGGLKEFGHQFPELIRGTMPVIDSPKAKKTKKPTTPSSHSGNSPPHSSRMSTTSSVMGSPHSVRSSATSASQKSWR